jgi:hypothetical protein
MSEKKPETSAQEEQNPCIRKSVARELFDSQPANVGFSLEACEAIVTSFQEDHGRSLPEIKRAVASLRVRPEGPR